MFEAEEKVDIIDKLTGRWLKRIWRCKFGAANHAFDTRVYNKAALEIFADDICRNDLGLHYLDWGAFWNYAKMTKAFFKDVE
jgi:phage terminase large subunit GpA-like protein